jgi:N-acetyltransferase 10
MYAQNLVDYHLVLDLVPEMAKLYFLNKLGAEFNLSLVQAAILIGMGLQHKSIEDLEKELQLPPNQLLALFNKVVKKIISLLEEVNVNQMNQILFTSNTNGLDNLKLEKMQPLKQSLEDELNEISKKVKEEEMEKKKQLINVDMKQYEIKGSEKEWIDALKLPTNSYVSVKRMAEKRKVDFDSHFDSTADALESNVGEKKSDHKNKKNKKSFDGGRDKKKKINKKK